jgi:hypothetical protein
VTRERHLSAACSVGKCPLALTARRYRALRDSMAGALHSTLWISTSWNGMNCSQALFHSRMIGGYRSCQAAAKASSAAVAAASSVAV